MKKNRIKIYAASLLLFLASGVSAQENFVIGEFTVSEILDGDTFKFERLDRPARLIGVDTEETFKKDDAELRTREIAGYWSEYYAHKKDSSGKPAKIESPFGYKTWQWTKDFLDDVVKVRLESDDAKRNTDMYDRYLVYVIAIRSDGTEFNYNIECVKHGYSPYFNKYGNSARFHDSFIMAQQYAQENMLGIWSGNEKCYPDYHERLEWWDKRSKQIEHFEKTYTGKTGYFSMLNSEDYDKLKNLLNDTVIVFGSISRTITDKEPQLVILEAGRNERIDLVFFAAHSAILTALDLDNPKNYLIYAKGKLGEYKGRPQIIIEDKSQIWRE